MGARAPSGHQTSREAY